MQKVFDEDIDSMRQVCTQMINAHQYRVNHHVSCIMNA